MRKTKLFKHISFICLCLILTAATVLASTSCQKDEGDDLPNGEKVSFTLKVVALDGSETVTEIETTKRTVGAALLEKGIIEGEEGPYGLYIKKVNGITADYDSDRTYWSFYIGDDYAMSGVDKTDIVAGTVYTLKVEK